MFHCPELPVGTPIKEVERARPVVQLLDSNNFVFKVLTVVPGMNGGSQHTKDYKPIRPFS
jgi:hypothetical protein